MKKLNFKIIALVIAGMTAHVNASEISLSDGFGSVDFFEATTPLETTTQACAAWVNHQIETLHASGINLETIQGFNRVMLKLKNEIDVSCQGKEIGDRRGVAGNFSANLADLPFYSISHYLSESGINDPIEDKHKYVREELERVNTIMDSFRLTAPRFDVGLVYILFPRPVAVEDVISTSALEVTSENAVAEVDTPLQADIRAKIIENIALVKEAFEPYADEISTKAKSVRDAVSYGANVTDFYPTEENLDELFFALECYFIDQFKSEKIYNLGYQIHDRVADLKWGDSVSKGISKKIIKFQSKMTAFSSLISKLNSGLETRANMANIASYMEVINELFPNMPGEFLFDVTEEGVRGFLESFSQL